MKKEDCIVGNLVICRYGTTHIGRIGTIIKVFPSGTYEVRDQNNDPHLIGGGSWSELTSFDHIRLRDMTDADRKIGVELWGIPGRYGMDHKVGKIHSLTGITGFYVNDIKGGRLGGGYWTVKDEVWKVIEVISYKEDLVETSDVAPNDTIQKVNAVSQVSSPLKLCRRKYDGVGECTCGTCQAPVFNFGFVKFKY